MITICKFEKLFHNYKYLYINKIEHIPLVLV